ncbi:MAG: hypothetical protein ACLQVD_14825 [Capsulimonadaceae bacterium]
MDHSSTDSSGYSMICSPPVSSTGTSYNTQKSPGVIAREKARASFKKSEPGALEKFWETSPIARGSLFSDFHEEE